MPEYYIRRMEMAEFQNFYKHIEQDFASGEYAPYAILYQQIQEGAQEALVFCEESRDLAYSVCASGHEDGYVLISLLAVFEDHRGQGIGSEFLKALSGMYAKKKAILVEVERPELSQTREERDSRRQRIRFYEKAGFYLIEGIDYTIWDVPMHMMALPLSASRETINQGIGQIMYEIYLQLMGKRFIHKLQIRVLTEDEKDNF